MKNIISPSGHRARPDRSKSKEDFWRHTLKQLTGSGQSVRAFCATRGLSEPSLYSWRRTLALRDAAASAGHGPPPTPALLPIRLANVVGSPMEIVLAGGQRIRLRPPVDGAALREVVMALQGTPLPLDGPQ
jgi:transposase-like protein